MKNKYGLHGKLSATKGNGNALAQILIKASELVSSAKGCCVYAVSLDGNDVWITEVWDSKDDHDKSLENAEVRALIGTAMPLLAGKPEKGQELDVIGGFGVGL
jgi:quinol monooxygenase YgiN